MQNYKKLLFSLLLLGLTGVSDAHHRLYPRNVIYIDQHPTIYHPSYRYGERVYLRRNLRPMVQYYYVTPDRLAPMLSDRRYNQ